MTTDVFSPQKRAAVMAAVRGSNTKPELRVRRLLHGLGYRFRLHAADLPGKPDIVFLARRKVIFVHGCFWHGHDCARGARTPKTNRDYWVAKIARNRQRDARILSALDALGWRVLTVWECALNHPELDTQLTAFLGPTRWSQPRAVPNSPTTV